MNLRSSASTQRTQCQQSAVSLAGMLMCVAACFISLMAAASDQTGSRMAGITRSFRSVLAEHGTNGGPKAAAGQTQMLTFRTQEPHEDRSSRNATDRLNVERSIGFAVDNKTPGSIDTNRPVFDHLLSEIRRFCDVSAVDFIDGEIAIDLLSTTTVTDAQIAVNLSELIERSERESADFDREYSVTAWAACPTTSSLELAALKASSLQRETQKSLANRGLSEVLISSCGQCWFSDSELRPSVTLVIRSSSLSE